MDAKPRLDYNQVAATYNQRYTSSSMPGVAAALADLARQQEALDILEVGCGTGYWLAVLQRAFAGSLRANGLDLSRGMLKQAQTRPEQMALLRGRAEQIPLESRCCDLLFCVNALHHFDRPDVFVREAHRLLRPGGRLAIFGSNPHDRQHYQWYVYQYFEGTYETDLRRFPRPEALAGWLAAVGFTGIENQIVETIQDDKLGQSVFDDPFLRKDATSQLSLLSPQAYAAGLQRIEDALQAAEREGEQMVFPTYLELNMLTARVS